MVLAEEPATPQVFPTSAEVESPHHLRLGLRMGIGANPAQAHRAPGMARRIQPVRSPRIVVGNDDPNRAIPLVLGTVMVEIDAVVSVVQRLHPVIIQLEIP